MNNTAIALILVVAALLAAPTFAQECNIKGNVSTQGERIYHVPGQKYYDDTRISASHGERWFCSEEEARAAGWRRSKV
ncbi:sunset domain-containing protein [Devosia riboflavina]